MANTSRLRVSLSAMRWETMLSKKHYAAWLYYSAAIQKEKNRVLKKKEVVPSPSLQPQNSPEKEVARVSPRV